MRLLAIDQGSHASRASLYDAAGKLLATSCEAIKTYRPQRDYIEHESNDVLRSVTRSVQAVLATQDKASLKVLVAGIACQRSSVVCWDRISAEALSPVISWQDRRTAAWIQRLASHYESIYQTTGLIASPHFGASKINWCLRNLPAVQKARRDKRLMCTPLISYILFHLLKESPTLVDYCTALRTQLIDIETSQWDPGLCEIFDIPVDVLPECVPNHYTFGHIATGFTDAPLVVATGDQSAMLYAQGPLEDATYYINVGTGAFVIMPTNQKMVRIEKLLTGILDADVSRTEYCIEATVNGAGSALEYVLRKHHLNHLPAHEIDRLIDASKTPALFINAVSGLGSPFWVADMESRFVGSEQVSGQIAGVIESIVFLLFNNIATLRHGGHVAKKIIISGGLSGLDSLCQKLSSLSETPIHRPISHEATSAGLANLMLIDKGLSPSLPGLTTIFQPRKAIDLQRRYSIWLEQMEYSIARCAS